jgi:hypothetical protein
VDAESLVKLLGSSRVVRYERGPGYLLLVPPASGVEVRAYRERFTRLSTELAWVFVASTGIAVSCRAAALGRARGFFRRTWSWEVEGEGAEELRALLGKVSREEPIAELLRRAKPEYVSVKAGGGELLVKVVKAVVGPYAGALREAYDLSWRLAQLLAEGLSSSEGKMNKK